MIEILGGSRHHDSRASLGDGRCFPVHPGKSKLDRERILVLGTSSSGALCVRCCTLMVAGPIPSHQLAAEKEGQSI